MVNLIFYVSDKVHYPAIKLPTTPQTLTIDTLPAPISVRHLAEDGMWRLLLL